MSKQGTCWDGYMQKGMKKKGGKLVPNCVPAMKSGGLMGELNRPDRGYKNGGFIARGCGKVVKKKVTKIY